MRRPFGWLVVCGGASCILSSVCVSDKFTARVYENGLGVCVCVRESVKGPVTRKGLDVSRRGRQMLCRRERDRVFILVYLCDGYA